MYRNMGYKSLSTMDVVSLFMKTMQEGNKVLYSPFSNGAFDLQHLTALPFSSVDIP
jgi:hypothetical protein